LFFNDGLWGGHSSGNARCPLWVKTHVLHKPMSALPPKADIIISASDIALFFHFAILRFDQTIPLHMQYMQFEFSNFRGCTYLRKDVRVLLGRMCVPWFSK
jgi:hypothetical protein